MRTLDRYAQPECDSAGYDGGGGDPPLKARRKQIAASGTSQPPADAAAQAANGEEGGAKVAVHRDGRTRIAYRSPESLRDVAERASRGEKLMQCEAADLMGISRERARRLEESAVLKLCRAVKGAVAA